MNTIPGAKKMPSQSQFILPTFSAEQGTLVKDDHLDDNFEQDEVMNDAASQQSGAARDTTEEQKLLINQKKFVSPLPTPIDCEQFDGSNGQLT